MRAPSVFILVLTLLTPVAAGAQERGEPGAGRAYAETACAEYHAVLRGETESRYLEATAFGAIANTPGMSGTAISVWLQTSHPNMPNIMLKPDDMHDVIAYILSLKD